MEGSGVFSVENCVNCALQSLYNSNQGTSDIVFITASLTSVDSTTECTLKASNKNIVLNFYDKISKKCAYFNTRIHFFTIKGVTYLYASLAQKTNGSIASPLSYSGIPSDLASFLKPFINNQPSVSFNSIGIIDNFTLNKSCARCGVPFIDDKEMDNMYRPTLNHIFFCSTCQLPYASKLIHSEAKLQALPPQYTEVLNATTVSCYGCHISVNEHHYCTYCNNMFCNDCD